MKVEVSDFSLVSIIALAVFLCVMIPRALFHLYRVAWAAVSGKPVPRDRWLIAIAVAFLVCLGLGGVTAAFNLDVRRLMDRSEFVALSFVLFAAPSVLQVIRAWANEHAKQVAALSHGLVALAVISLPASMAIPTAALMQSTAPQAVQAMAAARPVGTPGSLAAEVAQLAPDAASRIADDSAYALADERYFTENEVANDPSDFPIAAFLARNLTVAAPVPVDRTGEDFYRHVPVFTSFWFDQTTSALTFEATDTFGVLISRITHVRTNFAFSLAVFVYKLMCTLVLVAVTWVNLLRPVFERTRARAKAVPIRP